MIITRNTKSTKLSKTIPTNHKTKQKTHTFFLQTNNEQASAFPNQNTHKTTTSTPQRNHFFTSNAPFPPTKTASLQHGATNIKPHNKDLILQPTETQKPPKKSQKKKKTRTHTHTHNFPYQSKKNRMTKEKMAREVESMGSLLQPLPTPLFHDLQAKVSMAGKVLCCGYKEKEGVQIFFFYLKIKLKIFFK